MKTPLWNPSEERKQQANITRFMKAVNSGFGLNLNSYAELYGWSVENIRDFWAAIWDFAEIKASKPYDQVIEDLTRIPRREMVPGCAPELCRESVALSR